MRDDGARTYRDAPRDRGLFAHGVRAMRDDDAAQWLLRESGQQAVSQNWIPLGTIITGQFTTLCGGRSVLSTISHHLPRWFLYTEPCLP